MDILFVSRRQRPGIGEVRHMGVVLNCNKNPLPPPPIDGWNSSVSRYFGPFTLWFYLIIADGGGYLALFSYFILEGDGGGGG